MQRFSVSNGFKLLQVLILLSVVYAEDFYKLLGISRNATPKEVKKAYRQKSLELNTKRRVQQINFLRLQGLTRSYLMKRRSGFTIHEARKV
jgi:hypothetical protein